MYPRIHGQLWGRVSAGVLLMSVSWACVGRADVVYSNNFSGSVGPEWTATGGVPLITTAPWGQRFVGIESAYGFRWDTANLSLNGLPEHRAVTVSFDLYIIRSWDGDDTVYGPDLWRVQEHGGRMLLDTSFSNAATNQSFPGAYPAVPNYPAGTGAVAHNSLGYNWGWYYGDSTYALTFTFAHHGGTLVVDFTGTMYTEAGNNWGIMDESWGLDNVVVATLPYLPRCPGDGDCDGAVNWRDIDYLVAAQNDNVSAWTLLFTQGEPACAFLNLDTSDDGHVNWRDIDPFIALMNTTCR